MSFHATTTGENALDDHLGRMLVDLEPAGVFVCAALQSPGEHATAPSEWTALLGRAGAAVARGPRPPGQPDDHGDQSEYLAGERLFPGRGQLRPRRAGHPRLLDLGLADQSGLHLLAHHANLHPPRDPDDEAVAWLDGASWPDVTALLATHRATAREAANRVTGHTTAMLLHRRGRPPGASRWRQATTFVGWSSQTR